MGMYDFSAVVWEMRSCSGLSTNFDKELEFLSNF